MIQDFTYKEAVEQTKTKTLEKELRELREKYKDLIDGVENFAFYYIHDSLRKERIDELLSKHTKGV